MTVEALWRRELQRIRAEHLAAISRAADRLRRADDAANERADQLSARASRERGLRADPPLPGASPPSKSVLLPAHVDDRTPTARVQTDPDPDAVRRTWLV